MVDVPGLAILTALVLLFAWLTWRGRHLRRPLLKGASMVITALVALVFLVTLVFALIGYYRILAPRDNPVSDIKVAGTAAQIERGKRLAHLCVACHSSTGNLPLDGGQENLAEQVPVPIGVIVGPNLTPGGHLDQMSDGALVRAIREGLDNDGSPLLGMPTDGFRNLSDGDVQAIVAYLRSQPNVERDVPETRVNVLGAIARGVGLIPTSAQSPVVAPLFAPRPGTAEYGKYLAAVAGCRDCHGPDMAGGRIRGVGPEATNLTTHLKDEGEEDFAKTMRQGVDHEGNPIDPKIMPWKDYAATFSDEELKDMFAYLRSLASVQK